ncbi:hypothetical protein SLS53_008680 [Cytospora paraplurivora]|uniref:DUF6923 domain-containing protein n=1 Tax=Cytospora paraplurivora TaxID=2898453 RepID=A0AAN9YBW8_9PEZI
MASSLRSFLVLGLLALSPIRAEPFRPHPGFADVEARYPAPVELYGGASSVCYTYTTEFLYAPTAGVGFGGGSSSGGGLWPGATVSIPPIVTVITLFPGQAFTISLASLFPGSDLQVVSFTEDPPVDWVYYDPVTRSFYGTVPVYQAPGRFLIHVSSVDPATGQTSDWEIEIDVVAASITSATPLPTGTSTAGTNSTSTSSVPATSVSIGPAQTLVIGEPFDIDLTVYLESPTDIVTAISTDPDTPFLEDGFNAVNRDIVGIVPDDTVPQTITVAISATNAVVARALRKRQNTAGPYIALFEVVILVLNLPLHCFQLAQQPVYWTFVEHPGDIIIHQFSKLNYNLQQPKLSCSGLGYETQNRALLSVNLTSGASVEISSAVSTDTLNALAYHPQENYLYAVAQNNRYDGYILRIGANGTHENTTFVIPQTNPTGTSATSMTLGDIDANLQFWLGYANGNGWVQVNLNSANGTTYGQVVANGTADRGTHLVSDWAYLPAYPDRLWALGQQVVTSGSIYNTWLMYFDLTMHLWVDYFQFTGINGGTTDGVAGEAQWGAVYTALDGYLYGLENNSGQIWKFKVDSPTVDDAVFVSQGPAGGVNDGARCMLSSL